jgi:hypothetical protein
MGSVKQLYSKEENYFLTSDAVLWRYIPLRTLLFYITGNIFIPAVETLRRTDPFEGRFSFDTVHFNGAMAQRYGPQLNTLEEWIHDALCDEGQKKMIEINKDYPNYGPRIIEQHYFDFLRKTRYAWCWFLSDSESAAMWNIYGKQGVAIASTVEKVCKVLTTTEWDFEFARLRYIRLVLGAALDFDFNTEDPHDSRFLLRPHFLKRKEYETEKEVRFVTAAPDRGVGAGLSLNGISPNEWINDIRLWPGLRPTEEKSVRDVVNHFAPGVSCACSDLFGADRFSRESFAARYVRELNAVTWKQWKNGEDGISSELKQV